MVTILVPVYNAAPYLRQCIDSITGQTYTDLQVVLIDDGSTDGSWDILQELAKKDRRLEVYSQPNCGVAATRNRLLDKVRGDFVLFVDSDDWIELNTVETLLREQEKEDFDMVVFQGVGFAVNNFGVLTRETAIKQFLEHKVFSGMLWNKLMRNDVLNNLKLDESVSYGEDAQLVWKALQRVRSISIIKDELYHYRENMNSLSLQKFNGRKFSAYTVWSDICDDVSEVYPEHDDIAHARFACEMTQVLLAAAIDKYPKNSSVSLLQEVIHRDASLIKKTGISSCKMSFIAWLISHNYWLVKKLSVFLVMYSDWVKNNRR